jgi:hypothetical protein
MNVEGESFMPFEVSPGIQLNFLKKTIKIFRSRFKLGPEYKSIELLLYQSDQ